MNRNAKKADIKETRMNVIVTPHRKSELQKEAELLGFSHLSEYIRAVLDARYAGITISFALSNKSDEAKQHFALSEPDVANKIIEKLSLIHI